MPRQRRWRGSICAAGGPRRPWPPCAGASSNLEDNIANPLAPWIYGVSTLNCLTVSPPMAAGLGTAWGGQRARQMLTAAGFSNVTTHEAPGDPLDTICVATRPADRT